jgi:DNA-binding transcriptional LysR family regulator
MQRGNLDDLLAFLVVGRERSFTKAAAQLGMSQSSLSHTIRELEARLGVRLLTRTTRSVAPTEAGKRLLQTIGPHFEEIDAEVSAVRELREKPAGTIRITVADGYDAGVRSGEQVAKDMIAVRIGPDMRMAVVGTPSYFRKRPEPTKPQDLISHNCINLRLPSHGGLYAWEFEKGGRELKVRVDGQMTCNGAIQMLNAALAGHGLAYIPEEMAEPYLAKGRLKRVLGDWCQPYSGYHLFYPSRQSSAAFNLVMEALRYRR